jgi:hypothetical protein
MGNSEMLEVAFVEQTLQSTERCEGFATLNVVSPLMKMPNAWDIQQTKQTLGVKETVLQGDEV